MVDLLGMNIQGGQIVAALLDQLQAALQTRQVLSASGVHIIQYKHILSCPQEILHQIRADKTRATCHQCAHNHQSPFKSLRTSDRPMSRRTSIAPSTRLRIPARFFSSSAISLILSSIILAVSSGAGPPAFARRATLLTGSNALNRWSLEKPRSLAGDPQISRLISSKVLIVGSPFPAAIRPTIL